MRAKNKRGEWMITGADYAEKGDIITASAWNKIVFTLQLHTEWKPPEKKWKNLKASWRDFGMSFAMRLYRMYRGYHPGKVIDHHVWNDMIDGVHTLENSAAPMLGGEKRLTK